MAVMARLLAAKSFSQSKAGRIEVGRQKLAAKLICKELNEADEANLLDEEDMHVFGLKPMDDPLDLVCCNACKKPVKASQYAAHAELCRTLISMEESVLELDGSMRHRKPTRKERKKLLTAYSNQAKSVVEFERSESIDADDNAVSQSQLDGHIGTDAPFSVEGKTHVDTKYLMDGSRVTPGNTHSAGVMPPPSKRSKLIAGEYQPQSDDIETAFPVSKITSSQDAKTYMHSPLATKIYYSQRNNRFRSALCHLYCESVASTKLQSSGVVNSEILSETMIASQAPSQKDNSLNLINNKMDSLSLPSVGRPEQVLAQSLEVCSGTSGTCEPAGDFLKQFPGDNAPRLQATAASLTRNKYHPKPFSFTGNSGQPLGAVQQQNGSVPVI
ncbi:hypothetical protein FNV43_RR01960 [Rhamnella rubrinervis]|uniref:SCA7 domain-containing protein n=1 Tax=Rhamnella rubrinervis TaxID=2594499 RepID=A0A8K0HT55_9ROSA|nr:hypothetical protein FNV43_RR01960 [Rhamnella rubrinervis]